MIKESLEITIATIIVILLILFLFCMTGCQRTDFEGTRILYDNKKPGTCTMETVRLSTTEFGVDGSQDNLRCYIKNWGEVNADKLETTQSPELIEAAGAAIGAGIKAAVIGE